MLTITESMLPPKVPLHLNTSDFGWIGRKTKEKKEKTKEKNQARRKEEDVRR